MSYRFSILGVVAILLVYTGQAQVIKVLTINDITLLTNEFARAGEQLLKVCYAVPEAPAEEIITKTLLIAIMTSPGHFEDKRYPEFVKEEEGCIFFQGVISAYTDKEVWFILEGHDISDAPLIHGEAIFQLPGTLYTTDQIEAHMVGPSPGDSTPESLRLATASAGWDVCDTSAETPVPITLHCTDDSKTPPCYAIEIGNAAEYKLCIGEKEIVGIPVGEATLLSTAFIPAPSAALETENEPNMETLLEYGDSAKIKMVTTTVTEFVAYIDTNNIYPIATDPNDGCSIDDYNDDPNVHVKKSIKIIIVKAEDVGRAVTVTSNIIPFEDYGVNGAYLGDKIMEVYWKRTVADEHKFFGATISNDDGETFIETVVVDCSLEDADPVSCFGYFINLDFSTIGGVPYLINVAPNILPEGTFNPVLNNQIIETITHEEKDIPYTNIDMKMVDGKANVEVCFEPIKNISMSDSQYEFLAINSRGEWKRTTEVHRESDSFLCFHSVELPVAYFKENSKAFILLRSTKDRSVLASGQVKIPVQESSLDQTGDNMTSNSDSSVWMIVGASVGFLACLVALVALIYTKFIRKVGSDDGIEHPLHSTVIEDSNIIHAFDNPISTK